VSRSLRRGGLAAIAAIAIASLSACAAGNTAETLEVKPDTASATLGTSLLLNNIVVVTGAEASGEHTGPASVTVNISNTGTTDATLKTVTVGTGTASLTDAAGASVDKLVIPAGGSVLLGGPGAPAARVASTSLQVGGFAPTAFAFGEPGESGKVEAQASVYSDSGIYKGFGPKAPAASPGATASASATALPPAASASPSATGSPSASGSPSATATATATATGSPSPAAH
jgi:hypothetical protein